MAKFTTPQVGSQWTLKSGIGEADFTVTNVTMTTEMGGTGKLVIEGFPTAQRMGMATATYDNGYVAFDGFTPYKTTGIKQNTVKFTFTDDDTSKGMDVQIKTIETVDGTKAQIVLTVGTKNVIAWESDPFEDDVDLNADGAQTGEVKAKKDAEAHAKGVLKGLFNQ